MDEFEFFIEENPSLCCLPSAVMPVQMINFVRLLFEDPFK
jgi:hypothetical protein